jgi:hypothetical protein
METTMRNFKEALALITLQTSEMDRLEKTRPAIKKSEGLSDADKIDELDSRLRELEQDRLKVLSDLVAYPPHLTKYAPMVKKLQQKIEMNNNPIAASGESASPFGRQIELMQRGSVFIMTKYADEKDLRLDTELGKVIATIKDAVSKSGFYPHLVADSEPHEDLWGNVVCHMLVCSRRIALVESKYRPELNPNVAMEWGWMRAMDKRVLYLVEKGVKEDPANVSGLLKARFDWLKPEADIPAAVGNYLTL